MDLGTITRGRPAGKGSPLGWHAAPTLEEVAKASDKDLLCDQMLYCLAHKWPKNWFRTTPGREMERRRSLVQRREQRKREEVEYFARFYKLMDRLEDTVETDDGFYGFVRERDGFGRVYYERRTVYINPHSEVEPCVSCSRIVKKHQYTVSRSYLEYLGVVSPLKRRGIYTDWFSSTMCGDCHMIHGPRDKMLAAAFANKTLINQLKKGIANAKRDQNNG